MAKSVSIDELAAEITLAVTQYTESVSSSIEAEVSRTAKAVQEDIAANSPKDTGEYSKGWRRKKESGQGRIQYTVHNKSKPSIAHLLENGFARSGGGRQPGKPHIRPAYDRYVPTMLQAIEKIIKDGG